MVVQISRMGRSVLFSTFVAAIAVSCKSTEDPSALKATVGPDSFPKAEPASSAEIPPSLLQEIEKDGGAVANATCVRLMLAKNQYYMCCSWSGGMSCQALR